LGTINNVFASLANNSGAEPGSNLTLANKAPDSYSDGFELSLSQQIAAGGGANSDEVVLYAYGIDSNGDGVETVSMAEGDSPQSAYQSMMASINGFGDLGNVGKGGTAPNTPSQLDPLFADLANALGDNSGTASVGMTAAFPEQVLTQTQAAELATAPPQTLSQFVNSVVTAVENNKGTTVIATSDWSA
jgi:hypothetical protein